MRFLSKTKLVVGYVVGVATLLYVFSLANQSLNKYVVDSDLVASEYRLSALFSNIKRLEKEVDVSHKRYLLISKNKYKKQYLRSKTNFLKELEKTKKISNPTISQKIATYKTLVGRKFYFLDKSIRERKYGLNESLQILLTGSAKEISLKTKDIYMELMNVLERQIAAKVLLAQERSGKTKFLLKKTGLIGLVLFGLCGMLLLFDISKRQQYEKALLVAESKALKASKFKSEFLANMSHEIRTPLNSILGMAEVLEETKLDLEQEQLVRTFKRAGDSLLRIVNDVLDLSKVESGELKLEEIRFCLSDLLYDVKTILQVRAEKKQIELLTESDFEKGTQLKGDSSRLQQVLINLAGNSIKFTDKGSVCIKVENDLGGIRFSVTDTGIGISEDRISAIFSPFQQAEVSTSRKYGGTGLGLSISQNLIHLMGGRINVKSEIGHGSCFYFTLPLERLSEKSSSEKTLNEPIQTDFQIEGLNILVADDVKDNQKVIHLFLKKYNPTLVFVEDGEKALETFKSNKFDLVLMDVQMPNMNGLEATQAIRAFEKSNGLLPTPVIALTAQAFKEDRERCYESGCDLHVVKPIKKKKLLDGIQDVLINKNKKAV